MKIGEYAWNAAVAAMKAKDPKVKSARAFTGLSFTSGASDALGGTSNVINLTQAMLRRPAQAHPADQFLRFNQRVPFAHAFLIGQRWSAAYQARPAFELLGDPMIKVALFVENPSPGYFDGPVQFVEWIPFTEENLQLLRALK